MTPQEALSILDKLAASVTGSRAQHAQWINALDTLRQLLPPLPKAENGKPNGDAEEKE